MQNRVEAGPDEGGIAGLASEDGGGVCEVGIWVSPGGSGCPSRSHRDGRLHVGPLRISARARLLEQTPEALARKLGIRTALEPVGGLDRAGERDRLKVAVTGGTGPFGRAQQTVERLRTEVTTDQDGVSRAAEVPSRLAGRKGELRRLLEVAGGFSQEPASVGELPQ